MRRLLRLFLLEVTRDKLGGEVDDERQDHQNCRDGKGNVKLALFFGVDIERDGERCAGAGQTVKNAVQRVGKAGSEQQRGRLAENAPDAQDAAGDDAVDAAGKHHRAHHAPFACAEPERALAVALGDRFETLLRCAQDGGKVHDRKRQRAGKKRCAHAEHLAEHQHADQTVNDRRNAGERFGVHRAALLDDVHRLALVPCLAQVRDEVVVVGYGVQKKANLTGAVSSVKMDEVLGDRPVVSVSDALKGAMPGLQITGNSGRPGEEMSFNIRGVNSLDKNGKPLVLVDNVEMDINMLDPNDIESVTVLKDAASSAIYGARAAFGVILITTKKGSDSTRLSINYSNNFSFSRPANMPRKATPLQTVQAYKDMGTINYQSGQNVDTWLDLLKEYNANPSAYPDGYAMVDGLRYSLAETNLFDDMMETGFQQTHNLSVGGGTKDISYRFSFCALC